MATIRTFIRGQIGELLFMIVLSLAGAGVTTYLAVHDLNQDVPAQTKRIDSLEQEIKRLSEQSVKGQITQAQIAIVLNQLTREVQNLREDLRNR